MPATGEITQGSDETTVFLSRKDVGRAGASASSDRPRPRTADKPGVLWDPVPITMPTYVSKPLAPRTVRTIDLSGPDVTSSARQQHPVTADAPVEKPGDAGDGDPGRPPAAIRARRPRPWRW